MTYPAHRRTNLACSDNSRSLFIEIDSGKTIETEIIFPHSDIALMKMSVDTKCKRHRKLRNRLRRISRNSQHSYPMLLRCFYIYIVKTCTSKQDTPDLLICKPVYHSRAEIGIDERTYCIRTTRKHGRLLC